MSVNSMTGFARADGEFEGASWHLEARSVNGRGLDVRVRVPSGLEALEAPLRAAAQKVLRRGNVQVSLQLDADASTAGVAVNEAVLDTLVAAAEALARRLGSPPLRAEALLALRGVIEPVDAGQGKNDVEERNAAILASASELFAKLCAMRAEEGARLADMLQRHVDRIATLAGQIRAAADAALDVTRARIAEQVAVLVDTGAKLDPDRLHQEAVLIATRADIREELDRLDAHVAATCELIAGPGPHGRKLDFLAQEFNREANTICSKALTGEITTMGLELKSIIDQLREQVQNVE